VLKRKGKRLMIMRRRHQVIKRLNDEVTASCLMASRSDVIRLRNPISVVNIMIKIGEDFFLKNSDSDF
jgi:hypothetical protein